MTEFGLDPQAASKAMKTVFTQIINLLTEIPVAVLKIRP